MKFVWAGDRHKKNSELIFTFLPKTECDLLVLNAVDYFRVFVDGEFTCFGPERTASGYSRTARIKLSSPKKIEIRVLGYNMQCYSVDLQLPFFGAEIYNNGEKIADSGDFLCETALGRMTDVPHFSFQRGFIEVSDLTVTERVVEELYPVDAPVVIDGVGDTANYQTEQFAYLGEKTFEGFDGVNGGWWLNNEGYDSTENGFKIKEDFLDKVNGLNCTEYMLAEEKTGFVKLEITSQKETTVYAVMEEILPDGKWIYRRSENNEVIVNKVGNGSYTFISAEPYALKYLRILCEKGVVVKPTLIKLENSFESKVKVTGDERFVKIFKSAENTFRQNALDVFTDCPGRERAGWLCDSYFTGIAERCFTGKNDIEKNFLQNIILAKTPEIEKGMLPMCFPSEHTNGNYIPNWAMWFVLELLEYYKRTGDSETVNNAKEKVYGVVNFFNRFLNEDGLLENLEAWVFVEWSVANNADYVCGVNYPSNMLYAKMLECVSILYGDDELAKRVENVRKTVLVQSYNGEFFVDNAIRENGKLVACKDHISETCQYYALFMGLDVEDKFREKMVKEFGPLRKAGTYPYVGKSNMFIGNYLRFFYLNSIGEYNRVVTECLDYFAIMAEKTGTLWEHDTSHASCNHGFASVAAPVLLKSLVGFDGVQDGKPKFDGIERNPTIDVKVEFNY